MMVVALLAGTGISVKSAYVVFGAITNRWVFTLMTYKWEGWLVMNRALVAVLAGLIVGVTILLLTPTEGGTAMRAAFMNFLNTL